MNGRFGNDDAMSIAKDEAESAMRDAPAKRLQAEIEATLLRNLAILIEHTGCTERGNITVKTADVESMLRACAANLAMVLAPRTVNTTGWKP
jgi:hypothetical protein